MNNSSKFSAAMVALTGALWASPAIAQDPSDVSVSKINADDTMRLSLALDTACMRVDLSETRAALDCLRNTSWEMYSLAAGISYDLFQSDTLLPGQKLAPISALQYECIKPLREGTVEFRGVDDFKDHISALMKDCVDAVNIARSLTRDDLQPSEHAMVFNGAALSVMGEHVVWVSNLPSLEAAAPVMDSQGPTGMD